MNVKFGYFVYMCLFTKVTMTFGVLGLLLQIRLTLSKLDIIAPTYVTNYTSLLMPGMSLLHFIITYNSLQNTKKELIDYDLSRVSFISGALNDYEKSLVLDDVHNYMKVKNFFQYIDDVEYVFKDYLVYSYNFDKSKNANKYENVTYSIYTNHVFGNNSLGIDKLLDKIKNLVIEEDTDSFRIIDALKNEKLKNPCETKVSHLQIFSFLLSQLAVIEVKGLLAINFGYELREWLGNGNYTAEREKARNSSINRFNKIAKEMREAMNSVSNEFYVCDPEQHELGKTWIELIDPFQDKPDLSVDNTYRFKACKSNMCQILNEKEVGMCKSTDKGNKRICSKTDCYGMNPSKIFVNTTDTCILEQNGNVANFHIVETFPMYGIWYSCNRCKCQCMYKWRYRFYLGRMSVDTKNNYVVTGARFVVKDNIIFIQLQQGKLLPYGAIDNSTINWISLPKIRDELETINIFLRGFILDSVQLPDRNVVTGLQFIVVPNSYYDNIIGLKVYYGNVYFTRGTITDSGDFKKTQENENREPIPLGHRDSGLLSYDNSKDSTGENYVVFYTNQRTLVTSPLIDIQNVVSSIPTPLSGIGIIHKGSQTSAGFVGLSLYTYDLRSHVQERLD